MVQNKNKGRTPVIIIVHQENVFNFFFA